MIMQEPTDLDAPDAFMTDAEEPLSQEPAVSGESAAGKEDDFEATGFAKGEQTVTIPFQDKVDRKESFEFEIAGYSWTVLITFGKQGFLSVFLKSPEAERLPPTILPEVFFDLILHNVRDPAASILKNTQHQFTANESDWGFNSFADLQDLYSDTEGFMPNGSIVVTVRMRAQLDDKYTGATRKHTGFVGLKNQGATCYMNSLLQTLYHIPCFRRAVYHMPTEEGEDPTASISVALKYLFCMLQHSPTPVSTKDLIASFGWRNMEAFQQHDVEELELKLCEKLEEKMKGTIVDQEVDRLLKGKLYSFCECLHVDYKSVRREDFLDIQLDIMGCKNMYDSFDRITEVETLEGENKYDAEDHGLQEARKGVLLDELPPVLQLHLKRFDYDLTHLVPIKVNSHYEFYEELDLNREDNRYLSPSAQNKAVPQRYKLLSVLVHAGATHGGHYYAYIRPDGKHWFKFDDESVTAVTAEEAIQQQFGEDSAPASGVHYGRAKMKAINNAYMLVYVRASDWDTVMGDSSREAAPEEHVTALIQARLDEKTAKRREKMQAHKFVTLRFVSERDVRRHIERERFNIIDTAALPPENTVKVLKTDTWRSVAERVEALTGVQVVHQVYWPLARNARHGLPKPYHHFFIPSALGHDPIKYHHRELICTSAKDTDGVPGLHSTADPVELYVSGYRDTLSRYKAPQFEPVLLFVKAYAPGPPPRLTLAVAMVVSLRTGVGLVLRHLYPDATDYNLDDFLVWLEIKTTHVLELRRIVDLQSTLHSNQLESGDVLIIQAPTGVPLRVPRPSSAEREGVAAAAPPDSPMLPPEEEGAQVQGAAERGANGAASPRDPEFPTAEHFLRHLHSLRQIRMVPHPHTAPAAAPRPSGNGAGAPGPPAPALAAAGVGAAAAAPTPAAATLAAASEVAAAEAQVPAASTAASANGAAPASRRGPALPTVPVEVSRDASYEDVVQKLGAALHQDPLFLRLTLQNPMTRQPQRRAVQHGAAVVAVRCHDDIPPSQAITIYYEVLDMPLPDLEQLKALTVTLVKPNGELIRQHTIRLPPNATISQLLDKVRDASGLEPGKRLRVLKTKCSTVFEVLEDTGAAVAELDSAYWGIRVEPLAADDVAAEADACASGAALRPVCASHCAIPAARPGVIEEFGEPVVLLVGEAETFEGLQARIRARLKVDAEEFAKWRWGVRATNVSDPQEIRDPTLRVLDELGKAAPGSRTNPPYVCMVHEIKGHGARAAPRPQFLHHEGLTIS